MEGAARVNPGLPIYLRLAAATGPAGASCAPCAGGDVDVVERQLAIGSALVQVGTQVTEKGTKTHATRRIGLDLGTLSSLEEHRFRASKLAQRSGAVLSEDAFVFIPRGRASVPWRPGYVTAAFTRLRNALGVGARLHDLCDFTATRAPGRGD